MSLRIFSSFKQAIYFHNVVGLITIADFLLWFWYNLLSRRIVHYLFFPGEIRTGLLVQAKFYAYGIFKGEPHPYPHSYANKFNPLQKLSYFAVMFILVPLLLFTGVLFMYPMAYSGLIEILGGLHIIAGSHILLAFVFVSFLIVHMYLATTGTTLSDQYKSMVTGWVTEEEHDH